MQQPSPIPQHPARKMIQPTHATAEWVCCGGQEEEERSSQALDVGEQSNLRGDGALHRHGVHTLDRDHLSASPNTEPVQPISNYTCKGAGWACRVSET